MDASTVEIRCRSHADAMVAGDLTRAGQDLAPSSMAEAATVMKAMPKKIDSAEVKNVTVEGDAGQADIVYTGEGRDVTVRSRWGEVDGDLRITQLSLV